MQKEKKKKDVFSFLAPLAINHLLVQEKRKKHITTGSVLALALASYCKMLPFSSLYLKRI